MAHHHQYHNLKAPPSLYPTPTYKQDGFFCHGLNYINGEWHFVCHQDIENSNTCNTPNHAHIDNYPHMPPRRTGTENCNAAQVILNERQIDLIFIFSK